ncbi:MAG: hypothetical protein RIA69_09170 [Cyclobacteriaceae bacterium]
MGLFDKIKKFINEYCVTVLLEFAPRKVRRGGEIVVQVTVKANEDVVIKKIFLSLKATEETKKNVNLYEKDIELETNIELKKDETKTYNTSLQIPSDAIQSWQGKHSAMNWYLLAKTETPGVSPDSGWEKFDVV